MRTKPELHPACAQWPKIPKNGLIELAEDIKQKGLLEDITLTVDGKLLDGNSRWDACELAGVEPHTVTYQGDDPIGFVISKNKHRKHLEKGQLAMVMAKLMKLKPGQNAAPLGERSLSAEGLAKQSGIARSTIDNARAVLNHGAPNVVNMVENGEVNVRTAAEAVRSTPSKETQAAWSKEEVIKQGRKVFNAFPSMLERRAAAAKKPAARERTAPQIQSDGIEVKTGKAAPPEDHIPAHLLGGIITGDMLVKGRAVCKDDHGGWCDLPAGVSKLQRDEEVAMTIAGSRAFEDRKAYYKWQDYKDKNIAEKILKILSQIGPLHIPKVVKGSEAIYQYNLEVSSDLAEIVEMVSADLMRRANMLENRERFGHLFPAKV